MQLIEIEDDKPIRHYVDNEKLSEELVEWKRKYDEAKAADEELPRLTEYIGYSVMMIAKHKGQARNFRDYSYLNDMIGDGIENVLKYIHNFNPEAATKSGKVNAFGYISRIIDYAFIGRIQHEHRQAYYKYKAFEMSGLEGSEFGEDGNIDMNSISSDFLSKVHEYEEKMASKKEPSVKAALENTLLDFMNLEEIENADY